MLQCKNCGWTEKDGKEFMPIIFGGYVKTIYSVPLRKLPAKDKEEYLKHGLEDIDNIPLNLFVCPNCDVVFAKYKKPDFEKTK